MSLEEHIKNNYNAKQSEPPIDEMWEHIVSHQKAPTQKASSIKWWAMAASFAGLIMLSWLGYNNTKQQEQIDKLTAKMDSMFDNANMMQRIKMVHMPDPSWQATPSYVKVLLDRLAQDESLAVRIAAAEALRPYAKQENVSNGLLAALKEGKDPYLSIKIINILSDANMKSSIPHLEKIIKDNKQNFLVKTEAREAIKKIT